MTAATQQNPGGAKAPSGTSSGFTGSIGSWVLRLAGLALLDAIAIALIMGMLADGNWAFPLVLGVVTVLINIVFLFERFYPLRWVSPGMALMILLVVYPILFTIFISFTNYGDGHLLSQQQAIEAFEAQIYLPEDATLFAYTVYRDPDGNIMLWLQPDSGDPKTVRPGEASVPQTGAPPDTIEMPATEEGAPPTTYTKLNAFQAATVSGLAAMRFGDEALGELYQVHPNFPGEAGIFEPRYTYDADLNAIIDNQTGVVYTAIDGTFTAPDGSTLRPGYVAVIGPRNYIRLFTDPGLRQPFIYVFLWTVAFAALSVLITFVMGMFLAIVFDVPEMPARRLLRSVFLIPYAIPAFVSVPVWVGLLNPEFGVVSQTIKSIFGWVPLWFADPFWAKVGVLIIQAWLGIPYMFVIVTGALQTLPRDVYEASSIDGASAWQTFRAITLPLLLITVGPLLVASFAFNFNNFTVIELYNSGGPPMAGTASPVGYTDILATYTYRIAFSSGRGADQGYAAAITVIIFLIVAAITALQFRYTNMLEERGRNV